MQSKALGCAQPDQFTGIHIAGFNRSLVVLVVLVTGFHVHRDSLFLMERNPLSEQPGVPNTQCAGCVWHFVGGRGKAVDRCRRHGNQRVEPSWPGCPSHTKVLDCLTCGACCREAYHAVEVGPRDAFVRRHPDRVVRIDGRWNVCRKDGICACLAPAEGTWPCVVYAEVLGLDYEVSSWALGYLTINEAYLQMAVETQTDMVFMMEHFCGHGFRADDETGGCYKGPETPVYFDGTCIHPSPEGHDKIAELFDSIIAG